MPSLWASPAHSFFQSYISLLTPWEHHSLQCPASSTHLWSFRDRAGVSGACSAHLNNCSSAYSRYQLHLQALNSSNASHETRQDYRSWMNPRLNSVLRKFHADSFTYRLFLQCPGPIWVSKKWVFNYEQRNNSSLQHEKEYTHYFSMVCNLKIGQLISFKAFKNTKTEI